MGPKVFGPGCRLRKFRRSQDHVLGPIHEESNLEDVGDL